MQHVLLHVRVRILDENPPSPLLTLIFLGWVTWTPVVTFVLQSSHLGHSQHVDLISSVTVISTEVNFQSNAIIIIRTIALC